MIAVRVLVTGASGFIGWNFRRRHAGRFEIVAARHAEPVDGPSVQVDLADPVSIERMWSEVRPEAVLHLAGRTRPEACEADPTAGLVNAEATGLLARLATESGARLVYSSTDLVFDGLSPPYREDAPPNALSTYGRTKAAGERAVLASGGRHLVCRISLTYGPSPRGGVRQLDWMLAASNEGRPVRLYVDEFRAPIDALTLADALAELLGSDVEGILHVAGPERWSRFEFGRRLLERAGLDPEIATPVRRTETDRLRPADVTLDIGRARRVLSTRLLTVDEGLQRVMDSGIS